MNLVIFKIVFCYVMKNLRHYSQLILTYNQFYMKTKKYLQNKSSLMFIIKIFYILKSLKDFIYINLITSENQIKKFETNF